MESINGKKRATSFKTQTTHLTGIRHLTHLNISNLTYLRPNPCLTQPDKLYWKAKKNLLGGKTETKVIRASSSENKKDLLGGKNETEVAEFVASQIFTKKKSFIEGSENKFRAHLCFYLAKIKVYP